MTVVREREASFLWEIGVVRTGASSYFGQSMKRSQKIQLKGGQWEMTVRSERYKVTRDYESPYPDPIVFQKGESVKVGREFKEDPDWENWVWCEGKGSKKAWAPKQYIDIDGTKGIFKEEYNAMELSVKTGEELAVHEIVNGFGMAEKADGTRGWVPMRNMKRAH